MENKLRRQAIEALKESTELFEQAYRFHKANDRDEVERVCAAARAKRFQSAMLMRKASRMENDEKKL